MNESSTRLTDLLGIRWPLIQAPMAGGPTTSELVAAVSNAGALGSLGAALSSPSAMREDVARIRSLTSAPFAVNLFILDPIVADDADIDASQAALSGYRQELGLAPPTRPTRFAEDNASQFEALVELAPPVASFTFGILSERDVERLQRAGSKVFGTATSVAEALAWERVGADAVCLQGIEAGGHRGSFLEADGADDLGVFALVASARRSTKIPLIAAGGIMEGRELRAALQLGADAGQLGTAFLCCPESGASALWKATLQEAGPDSTELTRAFTGRYARALTNRFTREFREERAIAPYPIQNVLTREIRQAAAAAGRTEFLSYWAGQGVDGVRPISAQALVELLMRECFDEQSVGSLGGV